MTSEDAVIAVIDALERLGIQYMLVGSLSVNVYAIPRSTQDADFVLVADPTQWQRLKQEIGPAFQWEEQLSFETVTATSRQKARFLETGYEFEFFDLSDDPHDRQRFTRRMRVEAHGRSVWIPTLEDVIITKLRWSRQGRRAKDLDDVREILALSSGHVDWHYVTPWCDQHGTRDLLDQLRQSIPQPPP